MEQEVNKLQTVAEQSGLESTKAKEIIAQFDEFFGVADEWEQKAKTINVTDASQKDDIKLARVGRLFLKGKRIEIQNARKSLKDSALKEGQLIDSVAKILVGIIDPIEKYLKLQEDFVEIQEAARQKAEVDAGLALLEEQRVKKEEADAKAEEERKAEELKQQQIILEENKRLKDEADNKEIALEMERKANEEKLAEERREADEKLEADRKEHEAELEEVHKIMADELAKEQEQRQKEIDAAKVEQDKRNAELKSAQEETARLEAEKLELEGKITCPFCNKSFDR